MNRNLRAAAAVGGLVVIVAAFLLLRPSDDQTEPTRAANQPTPVADQPTGSAQGTDAQKQKPPAPTPEPAVLLEAGKVAKLKYKPGEIVRLRARSDTPDSVHVHGYNKSVKVPAGRTASLSFKANLEGLFEIELEESAEPIATLQVSP